MQPDATASNPVTFPTRLHVLFARNSSTAVVIRRGPSRAVCTIGWDRSDDTFTMGQWLRGRIYERRTDLSPNGKHLIYFAMNGRSTSPTGGSWTAISRAPHLKAIGLWGKGDCWHGGGLFLSSQSYWINDGYGHKLLQQPTDRLKRGPAPEPPLHGNSECLGVYFVRLLRDGWRLVGAEELDQWHSVVRFEKRIDAHWTLRKLAHARVDGRKRGQGVYYDEHELVAARTREAQAKHGWEWADVDGGRIVWAEKGSLYAAKVTKDGLRSPKLLHDFTPMKFEAITAPY